MVILVVIELDSASLTAGALAGAVDLLARVAPLLRFFATLRAEIHRPARASHLFSSGEKGETTETLIRILTTFSLLATSHAIDVKNFARHIERY